MRADVQESLSHHVVGLSLTRMFRKRNKHVRLVDESSAWDESSACYKVDIDQWKAGEWNKVPLEMGMAHLKEKKLLKKHKGANMKLGSIVRLQKGESRGLVGVITGEKRDFAVHFCGTKNGEARWVNGEAGFSRAVELRDLQLVPENSIEDRLLVKCMKQGFPAN